MNPICGALVLMTTLPDLFVDTTELEKRPLTAVDVDWRTLGIEQKYIIFITGRCGSTWLSRILADAKLFGRPDEFFNESFAEYFCRAQSISTFRDYLRSVVTTFKGLRQFGFELDPLRYCAIARIADFGNVFCEPPSVSFWITRADILSQAYSFAIAKKTGRWHILSESPSKSDTAREDITDQALWVEILLILEQEAYMVREFKALRIEPIPITYEQIVADKYAAITLIMSALGIGPLEITTFLHSMRDRTQQLSYGLKHDALAGFQERNWNLFKPILTSRNSLDLDRIRAELSDQFSMDIRPLNLLTK